MTWRKKWTLVLFAVGAAVWMAYWATAYAQLPPMPNSQILELPVTPTPTPIARYHGPLVTGTTEPLHYRCEKARDGTTITLIPLERREKVNFTFSCINCDCSGEK